MLAHARREAPDMQWQQADIADWRPTAPVDLLFTNAALHWLFGHEELFPRLVGNVAPGGFFACQIPRNFGAPSHQSIYAAVREGDWRERQESALRSEPTKEIGRAHVRTPVTNAHPISRLLPDKQQVYN